jgi:HEAT repeats
MADSAGRRSRNTHHARTATKQLLWLLLAALATTAWLIGGGLQAQQPPPPAPTAPSPPTVAPAQPTAPPAGPGTPQAAPPAAQPGPVPDAPPVPTVVPLAQAVQPPVAFTAPRMPFKIDPNTPLKDLLPTPPKTGKAPGPMLTEDLTHVPEVEFQALAAGQSHPGGPIKVSPLVELALELLDVQQPLPSPAALDIAHQIAKINHLNSRTTDGFVEALRGQRPDLTGLPFAMGDACRTKGERSRQFAIAAATVRRSLQKAQGVQAVSFSATARAIGPVTGALIGGSSGPPVAVGTTVLQAPAQLAVAVDNSSSNRSGGFWEQYEVTCADEDRGLPKADRALREHVTLARIAALMQILAPETPDVRLGLVKYLAGVSHSDATRALARLAVFSAEDEVRLAAVEALKVRRERDYTDILVQGLRHPWPGAARHAADAIARLERTDLTPQLVALLEDPDPRAPALKEVNGKKAPVVRELVRVNHHRSCLLCHAPGNTGTVSAETLTAAVPTPGEPLPGPAEGYNNNASPDMLVRLDVTYLRQDFSVFQAVADTAPWPELQRFDFLVRERVLTEEEAAASREKMEQREPGRLPPHQRAALAALRELTGKDTAPTAEAWRKLLGLPAPASGRSSSSTTSGGG